MIDLGLIKLSLLFIGYVIHQMHVFPFRIWSETIDLNMIFLARQSRRNENKNMKKKKTKELSDRLQRSLRYFHEKYVAIRKGNWWNWWHGLTCEKNFRSRFVICLKFISFVFIASLACSPVVVSMSWMECFGCDSTYKLWISLFYLWNKICVCVT